MPRLYGPSGKGQGPHRQKTKSHIDMLFYNKHTLQRSRSVILRLCPRSHVRDFVSNARVAAQLCSGAQSNLVQTSVNSSTAHLNAIVTARHHFKQPLGCYNTLTVHIPIENIAI